MTNQEIAKLANDITSRSAPAGTRWDDLDKLTGDIFKSMLSLVSQAYEEAARAACPYCAKDFEHDRCDAAGIHELKEQLQPAPALS